jgi:hypothetical protein
MNCPECAKLRRELDEMRAIAAGLNRIVSSLDSKRPEFQVSDRIDLRKVTDLLGNKQWRPREMAAHLCVDIRELEMFLDYYPANFARNERGWISLKAA